MHAGEEILPRTHVSHIPAKLAREAVSPVQGRLAGSVLELGPTRASARQGACPAMALHSSELASLHPETYICMPHCEIVAGQQLSRTVS